MNTIVQGIVVLFGLLATVAVLCLAAAVSPATDVRPHLQGESMALINLLTPLPRSELTDLRESTAWRWVSDVMAPNFAPPVTSRFILVPMDKKDPGVVDRMALAYEADNAKVTVAQSISLFLLEIERPEWIKEKRLLKAEEILGQVRLFFKDGRMIKVVADYGDQGWLTGDPDQVAEHVWLESMGWIQKEGHLSIWFLKRTGGGWVPSLSVEENRQWFTYGPDENPYVKPTVTRPANAAPLFK
jgi:hypothetical protein